MGTIERPTAEDLPAPAASTVSPELVHTYRLGLTRDRSGGDEIPRIR